METPGARGLEGYVEMMAAGKTAGRFDLAEDTPDDGAQGVLHDLVVRDQALWGLVAHGFRW